MRPSTNDKTYKIFELPNAETLYEWLECESAQLVWQKRSAKDVPRIEE